MTAGFCHGANKRKAAGMDFENLSQLNALINVLSGNMLPTRSTKIRSSVPLKFYHAFVWLVELTYQAACILGIFYVSKEKALQDSTVNMVVFAEVVLLLVHLNGCQDSLRSLVGKLNTVLSVENDTLRAVVTETVKPLQKPLGIYTVVTVGSVLAWTGSSVIKILQRDQFTYEDYKVPAVFSKEPFSALVFVSGVSLQMLGAGYIILKKTSLDIYTMHLVLLVTAQYKYVRAKLAMILGDDESNDQDGSFDCHGFNYVRSKEVLLKAKRTSRKDLDLLIHHHGTVIQITIILKKVLGVNMNILYINNVLRFCFLGIMIITISAEYFDKTLVALYAVGAVTQLYVLCFCIQQLFEASTAVTDTAFHAEWYAHGKSLRRMFATMILANKLECRLSTIRNTDLTLPSFMSILNQAYSVCILFLRLNQS